MKHSALRTLAFATVLLLPGIAFAHPGHSVLDPMAGAPHAGHEAELASLLLGVALFAGAGWLKKRCG